MSQKDPAEKAVRDIRRKTRKRYSDNRHDPHAASTTCPAAIASNGSIPAWLLGRSPVCILEMVSSYRAGL